MKLISRDEFFRFYEQDQEEWRRRKAEKAQKKGGPGFYTVQDVRLGRRFAYAVVAAREGRILYREAYELTDIRGTTFSKYADRLIQRMKDRAGKYYVLDANVFIEAHQRCWV